MDAGPQVKILCLENEVEDIISKLRQLKTIKCIIVTKPGKGAYIVDKHLF
jgi:mevalonate pyrophosphate decarboxylase